MGPKLLWREERRSEGGRTTEATTGADTVCVCVLRDSRGRKGGREGCSSLLPTALGAQAWGLVRARTCFRLYIGCPRSFLKLQ